MGGVDKVVDEVVVINQGVLIRGMTGKDLAGRLYDAQ